MLCGWHRSKECHESSREELVYTAGPPSLRGGRKPPSRAVESAVAEFIDPDLGDKVNSGIGLSYQPATLQIWVT